MIQKTQEILGFKDKEIELAVKDGRLLSMEIEFGSCCNLRCIYCYSGHNLFRDAELELEEMFDVISQAKALGARKIIYVGAGEPLLDIKLRDIIRYVHKLDMEHILFTNATLINPDIARLFYKHNLSVIVKYTSMKSETYDWFAGVSGAYESMQRGMNFLFKAGYPDKTHHLGAETVVCNQNINEIPSIWQWARENNIIPYVECLTHQGLARKRSDLYPQKEAIHKLFDNLSKIDAKEVGFHWEPHPPIAAFSCKRHLYSCTVNSQGFVQPCVGIDIKAGNIREEKLAYILRNNKVVQELSKIRDTIKGPCKSCNYHMECYGCRGTAYNLTGDYLASDSTCWRAKDEASISLACSKK